MGSESYDDARVDVLSLSTGERRALADRATHPRYLPSGHLIFARAGQLLAVRFDADRLAVGGSPAVVLDGVAVDAGSGAAHYDVGGNGTLAYLSGGSRSMERELVLVGRDGSERGLPGPPRPYVWPRLSPDGRQLALAIEGKRTDIWVQQLDRGAFTRVTTEAANSFPVWGPDATRLTFSSDRDGPMNVYVTAADGSGTPERLWRSPQWQRPGSWSSDGKTLAFVQSHPGTGQDLWLYRPAATPSPALQTVSLEGGGLLSPDGRWLAFVSDVSGRYEVYVRDLVGSARQFQVSVAGGAEPVWARDGRELFYRTGERMMVATFDRAAGRIAPPRILFEDAYIQSLGPFPNYDVTADGREFVMVKPVIAAGERAMHVLIGWTERTWPRAPQ
jgi:serine/threonine-protein kinase